MITKKSPTHEKRIKARQESQNYKGGFTEEQMKSSRFFNRGIEKPHKPVFSEAKTRTTTTPMSTGHLIINSNGKEIEVRQPLKPKSSVTVKSKSGNIKENIELK